MLTCPQTTSFKRSRFLISILSVSVLLNACGNGSNVAVDESLLNKYNSYCYNNVASQPKEGVDCYLDFSDGMMNKFLSSQAHYDQLSSILMGTAQKSFYRVGASDQPVPISSEEANFRYAGKYNDQWSKLESSLKSITSNLNKTSVFVTDFERIDGNQVSGASGLFGKIYDGAWGKTYFEKWFSVGNQIDVFATPCTLTSATSIAKGEPNWVYTIVFTPKSVLQDQKLSNTSLAKVLREKSGAKHFAFNPKGFNIIQEGTSKEMGNANDEIQPVQNIVSTKDRGYEFYEFLSGDLLTFMQNEPKDKRIINKLRIVAPENQYSAINYQIKVYDVTTPLQDLFGVLGQAPAEAEEDPMTGKVTIKNKPLEYKFAQGDAVTDVFDVVYNEKTQQVGITLKDDFAGVSQKTIYKIDILPSQLKGKKVEDNDNVLALKYSNPKKMIDPLRSSLQDAITSTVASIDGKPIYSIYVQID